ncbi:LOW QUALITY PROTEIN: ankycorbin [Periophthalmus magnuspinnatus]|uniref:LOW QUALITY PROTEIN: ankycorbin n=1 Tax=Periophthalmus magnuspinnatus TaxID=409849 RepID=UPI0024364C55|nr:LOW QUALITY PROTEIN: ankycorbin [Periophthalmus magnuspinnatus]
MKSLKAKFRKTDTNEWNKNDERLLAAVEHGEADKVTSLLAKKGTSAIKLDSEGKSVLHAAAAWGQTECLVAILSHGADPSITDATGLSPLHLAAKNNHVECCKKLIQSKCPIDAVDSSGKTAVHHGAASGSLQAVQLLCEQNSPINIRDADGLTPLLLSARHGHAEVCSVLLDCGAEINASDNGGRTAVMLACESSSAAVVDTLVQHGADLSVVDSQGHDVGHYAKLSSSSELQTALAKYQVTGPRPIRSPQHDQVAKLTDERITTPKKRKAPPPPISPLQSSGPSSPSAATSAGTTASGKSDTPKQFNYKEDELRRMAQKELQEEKNMLLNTIEDLKLNVEHTGTESEKDEYSLTASSALVSALQAKITALTLENQKLKCKSKDELEGSPSHPDRQTEVEDGQREEGRSKEEIQLLRQALESVQVKLLETRKENRSLQAQLRPERLREEDEGVREKEREAELMESLAELQAKLTDTQERYHQALEEVEELRLLIGPGDTDEKQEVQRRAPMHEHEGKTTHAQLLQSENQKEKCLLQIKHLEEAMRRAEDKHNGKEQRSMQIEELYKEAVEEIRVLQEALRGTVPVEAAAKDFEEMKGELNEVISGLQRRLLELSHSYSETKSQLSAAQKQLSDNSSSSSSASEQQQGETEVLQSRVEKLQACLQETERKYCVAQQEITQLRQEAERQMDSSVSLTDHTQVVASLGNAIKDLEKQLDTLKEQLHQKTLQLDALQSGLVPDKSSNDSVSHVEYETMKEQLQGEVSHLMQLLQGALRKQDEMALEAADAWQQARDNRTEREALQELVMSKEKDNQTLSTRLAESQDAVSQLKQLVENHVASEREKNKTIDDLSREVCKLKDALNSLSQLSYNSSSPSKRQQQNQHIETMQQQIKQLQYQLTESKKQHHEIVSVYRMHLLYAVQGQMDEDVQKALKQILMMCKMPSQAKEAC